MPPPNTNTPTLTHKFQKSLMGETNNKTMVLFPTLKRPYKDGAAVSLSFIQIKLLVQIQSAGYYMSRLRNTLLFILTWYK